jgi:hypothetical protein
MLAISSIKLNLTHKMTTPMTGNEIHTTTLTCTYCLGHTEIGRFKSFLAGKNPNSGTERRGSGRFGFVLGFRSDGCEMCHAGDPVVVKND